jgi:hypothetical protein
MKEEEENGRRNIRGKEREGHKDEEYKNNKGRKAERGRIN